MFGVFFFFLNFDFTNILVFKKSINPTPPICTLNYYVLSNDTIERIALKYNTVPSEIIRLNRLSMRMLYPGQVLYVPDPSYIPPTVEHKVQLTTSPLTSPTKSAEVQHFKWKPSVTPKPGLVQLNSFPVRFAIYTLFIWPKQGHIERSSSATAAKADPPKRRSSMRHTLSEDEAKRLDEECMQRFLKINSKIITYTNGIIDGVLLITPSAVMFDPINNNTDSNKKSEIVGRTVDCELRNSKTNESDSVIIPIEMISNVILYEDLSLREIRDYFELR